MRETRRKPEHDDALPGEDHGRIEVRLGELLGVRGMTLAELSERVGLTIVNLSILKNGRARAIRFSTLAKLCGVLDCQPGDLLSWRPGERPCGVADQPRGRRPRGAGRKPADPGAWARGKSWRPPPPARPPADPAEGAVATGAYVTDQRHCCYWYG